VGVKPYYSDASVEIFHGDCYEILRQLPEATINCAITSPPYWGLRDYGTACWEGGEASCDHKNFHGTQGKTGRVAATDIVRSVM
jgi:site-specific DNA-methyltransferase (cytosine-N4-specific)